MTAYPTQRFAPFTPEQWAKAKALIQDKTGIVLTDDSGQKSAKGVTLSYSYDATAQTLEIQLLSRSFYDPSAVEIDADIQQMIQGITAGA